MRFLNAAKLGDNLMYCGREFQRRLRFHLWSAVKTSGEQER